MSVKRAKIVPVEKLTVVRVRPTKLTNKVNGKEAGPKRKLFDDANLWGALPDMGKWAFPLLKELRNE